MKSKINSKIVLSAFALLSATGCNPKVIDDKLLIHTFFNLENAAVSKEKAYIKGVEMALIDFKDLATNVHYENVTSVNRNNVQEYVTSSPFFINVGTLDESLQKEIETTNLIPSLFTTSSVKEGNYTSKKDQFSINPDPITEAKLIAEKVPKNAYIIYSNEPVYEAMYSSFLAIYGLENIKGTTLLPTKSNAFKELISDILTTDFDVFLFLTNAYDTTNLIYALSVSESEKALYTPSYAKRFFTLPPNYPEAAFATFHYNFNYHLLLNNEELPINSSEDISERDFTYFIDGYCATHFLLSNYEQNLSKNELINRMHNAYKLRDLSGEFIPFL